MFSQNLYPYGILLSMLGPQEATDGTDQSKGSTGGRSNQTGAQNASRVGIHSNDQSQVRNRKISCPCSDNQAKDLEPLSVPFLCIFLALWVNLKHCPNGHYITIIDLFVHCLLKTISFLRIILLNYSIF